MKVEIIKDSISKGKRITTFHLQYWRPILAEMNTHRVFSRNASSSRAMGFDRIVKQVTQDTYLPTHWNAEQKGMTGGEEFTPEIKSLINSRVINLANTVVDYLRDIDDEVYSITGKRIHKQYINRYLEPFRPVDQLVTSTEWDNFFKLRCAPDAQPEIKDIAEEMRKQLEESVPQELNWGVWHLPYITEEELEIIPYRNNFGTFDVTPHKLELIKLSAARCARISYSNYDATHTKEGDLKLAERLLKNGHLSPFEHQATPVGGKCFNLTGWQSARHYLKVD